MMIWHRVFETIIERLLLTDLATFTMLHKVPYIHQQQKVYDGQNVIAIERLDRSPKPFL